MMSEESVLFIAPIGDQTTGYGIASNSLASVLCRMREQARLGDLAVVDRFKTASEIEVPERAFDMGILVCHPNILLKETETRRILYRALSRAENRYLSILWETSPLPSRWNPIMQSDEFTGFVAPSQFLCDLLRPRTEKEIWYWPYFVDVSEIPIVEKDGEHTFTVLFLGQYTIRKGILDAVIAFSRALGEKEDARLVLKYQFLSDKEIDPAVLIHQAAETNCVDLRAEIYCITEDLARQDVLRLLATSSVLLFPSRGEGFGLPPAEAMAAGIPVIYTDWSATTEFCEAPGNYPIRYVLDEAHSMAHHGYERGSLYAVPKMSDLCNALEEAYTKWKKQRVWYYEEARDNRTLIEGKFGYEAVAKSFEYILDNGR